ncbi:MAG: type II toxin-antitoxin system PemK/MazF family toxin [Alphaproteobacteria bacterium]|nr:type II toxin-antitoxin system PemK/MazF family toxin [Alphaproteobacteria bacterium]
MKRGEIWWVSFDPAQGSEIQKTRPAVIVSNDAANRVLNRAQVIPISSQVQKIYVSETLVRVLGKQGKVMADQIRTVDKSRIKTFINTVSDAELAGIERIIKIQLGLT